MSSFKITDEQVAKLVSSIDDTVNKIQGNPYLDELFKNLIPVKMAKSDETIANEAGDEEAKKEINKNL